MPGVLRALDEPSAFERADGIRDVPRIRGGRVAERCLAHLVVGRQCRAAPVFVGGEPGRGQPAVEDLVRARRGRAERALPTVIGPTENTLRALLAKTLSTTAITDYEAWVTLNIASRAASDGAAARSWHAAVAEGLKRPVTAVDDVITRLRTTELLDEDGALTDRGAVELAAARVAVRDVT